MKQPLSEQPSVPVRWLMSKKNGELFNHFVRPQDKAEKMLALIMDGHEDVMDVYEHDELKYLGSFSKGNEPF